MIKKEYLLKGLGCANCAAKIEDAVSRLEGVENASVNFATAVLFVELKDDCGGSIRPAIENIVHSIESHVEVLERDKRTAFEASRPSGTALPVRPSGSVLPTYSASSAHPSGSAHPTSSTHPAGSAHPAHPTSPAGSAHPAASPCTDDCCTDFEDKSGDKPADLQPKKKNRFSFIQYIDKKRAARILIGVFFYLIGILIHVSHGAEISFLSAFNLSALNLSALDFLTLDLSPFGIVHQSPGEYLIFIIAYLIIGGGVVYKAFRGIIRRSFFDENFLMTVATIGAFAIGEFPEAVAVMLFYQIGELFQEAAVSRSRKSVYEMMDIRPDYAHRIRADGGYDTVSPYDVEIGDSILIKPGEKVPLDSTVLTGTSFMDTSALTGESVPKTIREGDSILSGGINKSGTLTARVEKSFEQSTASKILDLVENAASKKAPTEKFITRFSRYYTPLVILAAILIAVIPPLVLPGAMFNDWIYRGLFFLVISCPCALVISVPLSYFGGIGAASKKGILVKGSHYLEGLTRVKTVVFDKTGTLSKGVFDVVRIDIPKSGIYDENEVLLYSAAAESFSNHPIALSIVRAARERDDAGFVFGISKVTSHTEYPGLGVKAVYDEKEIAVGNLKLMKQENVILQNSISGSSSDSISDSSSGSRSDFDLPAHDLLADMETRIYVAVNGRFAGTIAISDVIKPDSWEALERLKRLGVNKTVMVTGDTDKVGRSFAAGLNLDDVYTERLPHEKVEMFEQIETETKASDSNAKVAFVGDGINDAPVLTRADIGIAVGGIGSDAAVEAADVVLMTGDPARLADAFEIAKMTQSIVYQNIIFALGAKFIFMALGLFGVASMWEAVFGDVGVTLIAILNSMRLLRRK